MKKTRNLNIEIRNKIEIDEKINEFTCLNIPVVVFGDVGKCFYLKEKFSDSVIIDAREIIDFKNLTGYYAFKDGEINYNNGVLITSMEKGRTIIIKRIDLNMNLIYFLYSVIKYRTIVNSLGVTFKAHKDFKLIFSSKNKFESEDLYFVGPIRFEYKSLLSSKDLVGGCLKNMLEFVIKHRSTTCAYNSHQKCDKICLLRVTECFNDSSSCLDSGEVCGIHFRDLVQLKSNIGHIDKLTYENRTIIYLQFCNIFLKHDSQDILALLHLNQSPPVILYEEDIGRTNPFLFAVRNLICNVKNNTKTLLIGETGSGKTSAVQYLARNSMKHFNITTSLKVINMSSDFDGSDLIGGYSTLDISKKIRDLYQKYKITKPNTLDNQVLLENLKSIIINESDEQIFNEISVIERLLEKKVNFVYKEGLLIDSMRDGTWVLLDEINLCNEETLNLIESLLCKDKIVHFDSDGLIETIIHPNFRLFACMNPFGDHGKKRFDSYYFNHIYFYDFTTDIDDINMVVKSILKDQFVNLDCQMIGNLFFDLKNKIINKQLVNRIEPLLTGRTLVRALTSIKDNVLDKIVILSVLFLTQFDFQSKIIARNIMSEYFHVKKYTLEKSYVDSGFILTPKVQLQVKELKLSISLNYPILVQGDTSTGKTSMIYYLASKFNKNVLRINNHEHTEASDYLGNYVTTQNGIEFKEGAFIKSLRRGDWIILDELNLAPSDVLEVLNRLLDDNREIFVPQLNETIKPHKDFRIFATQNIEYGGRKGLSKAFRNRFIEIFFEEKDDLEVLDILHLKSELPKSFCKKMVDVYSILKNQRNISCLITLRDLFRWANRIPRTMYEVFETGMSIIYERQRTDLDRSAVFNAFLEVFSNVEAVKKFNFEYKENDCFRIENLVENSNLIYTKSVRKLLTLLFASIKCNEPVLIVGETGIGKTKVCNIVSESIGNRLVTLNMHSGTESSDFIGAFTLKDGIIEWKNGPLIESMTKGQSFLIDEINLAEDSVLERLNSLFETSKELFVTEIEKTFVANKNFLLFATMNPGNDFGKRELSPALRNRFTEIYYELNTDEIQEIFKMILTKHSLSQEMVEKIFTNVSLSKSLRSYDSIVEFITSFYKQSQSLVHINPEITENDIALEALSLVDYKKEQKIINLVESESILKINHYSLSIKNHSRFNFSTDTTRINLLRILRAMILQKGILLEGEPGVGKTSIVTNLAKIIGKKCIRINLSEQTELSDLVGTYIPTKNGIEFVPSELTLGLRDGYFIILDEINLCTQSVIEGLNSVLDYRRTLFLPEMSVKVHPETKIFATMNPCNNSNGRKILPRSFRDRFIVIYMSKYTDNDVKQILKASFELPQYFSNCSLRENIKRNLLKDYREGYTKYYKIAPTTIDLGSIDNFNIKKIPNTYTILHSQIRSLEKLILSLNNNLPVILSGGIGKLSMVRFVCEMLGVNYFDFICHKDIDTSDLLGQYHKVELVGFEWKDSQLVNSLKSGSVVVFHNPELVEKCIFDRLNSLFESERQLNVYEKGYDTNINVHKDSRLILISNNFLNLSPALIDRCVFIDLPDKINSIDLFKIFCQTQFDVEKVFLNSSVSAYSDENKRSKYELQTNLDLSEWNINQLEKPEDLFLEKKRFEVFGRKPNILQQVYKGITNMLLEDEIDRVFEFKEKVNYFDVEKIKYIEIYKKFYYEVPFGLTDYDKLEILENCSSQEIVLRTLNFIKNCDLSVIEGRTCFDLNHLKKQVLKSVKNYTFKDYTLFKNITEKLSIINFSITNKFNYEYFDMLKNLNDDPLKLYKDFLEYEMIGIENEIGKKIHLELKKLYKYGEGNIEPLVLELKTMRNKYQLEIEEINKKLPRDYNLFKKRVIVLNLEDYYKDKETKVFFEGFSDIFNYFLLFLLQKPKFPKQFKSFNEFINSIESEENNNQSDNQLDNSCSYESLVCYILNTRNIYILKKINCNYLGLALCRLVYSIFLGNLIVDSVSLVMESLNSEYLFDCKEINGFFFTDKMLNECLINIFKPKKEAYLFDTRKEVCIDYEIGSNHLISSLSINSTPQNILTKIESDISSSSNLISYDFDREENILMKLREVNITETSKELNILENLILKYFKISSSCTWQTNYRYLLSLIFNEFSDSERFFLDSLVFEFYDKITIAECVALKNNNPKFYNTVLQYKAFEIEVNVEKKIKDSQSKLRKEPKLFKKIHEELKNYLILPVTGMLNINFDKPACDCDENELKINRFSFLIPKNEVCECENWIKLSENFNRREIEKRLERFESKNRVDLINEFYNRDPEDKFSYQEICLSKTINRITEDPTHLKLIEGALKYPNPSFLYFVFQYAEDNEKIEYEDGTGIKSGTGEKNISDQIKEEDEISNEYDENREAEDDDGVDLDNQGDISSCDEEEASQTGVEGEESVEDDKKEIEKEEDSKENDSFEDNNNEVEELEEENGIVSDENEVEEEEKPGELEEFNENNEEQIEDPVRTEIENEYIYKEQTLNNNQTSSIAQDYDRKVFGDNQDEEALCEGEGSEQILGNDKLGESFGESATINFNYSESSSHKLTLLLKSIFESNSSNKYKGDYKSGKKLNMRKIIPYIASDYRKDKIWMKRRRSDKKEYVVRLFVDNSKSMYSQTMIDTLLITFSRLTNSFKAIGIPVEIYKFGDELIQCDIKNMTFSDSETNIEWIEKFKDGINIVLTDGVFQNTSFYNNNFLIILIDRSGIKKMSKVSVCEGSLFVQKYLDQFHLKYCLVEKVEELENTFILALSELIKNTNK